jgi:hypothetical protein
MLQFDLIHAIRLPIVALAIAGMLLGGCATPSNPGGGGGGGGGGLQHERSEFRAGRDAQTTPAVTSANSMPLATADEPVAVEPLTPEQVRALARSYLMIAMSLIHGQETPLPSSVAEGTGELVSSPLIPRACAAPNPTITAALLLATCGITFCAAIASPPDSFTSLP